MSSQEKPKEIKKKVPNDTTVVERPADSLYIKQMAAKEVLDSLIRVKQKK